MIQTALDFGAPVAPGWRPARLVTHHRAPITVDGWEISTGAGRAWAAILPTGEGWFYLPDSEIVGCNGLLWGPGWSLGECMTHALDRLREIQAAGGGHDDDDDE